MAASLIKADDADWPHFTVIGDSGFVDFAVDTGSSAITGWRCGYGAMALYPEFFTATVTEGRTRWALADGVILPT